MKTVNYEWELGREKLVIQTGSYFYTGGLYIALYQKDNDEIGELFCDLTINLPGYSLEPNVAFIDGSSSKDKLAFIEQYRLGKILPKKGHSGMGEYAMVAFDLDRLGEFDKKGIAEYKRSWGMEQMDVSIPKSTKEKRR
ncbi:MAG: DUF4313 domain-containing protein [Lachnospiraceae bacterium]